MSSNTIDTSNMTFPQYFVFGNFEEEWIPGSYCEPWIWKSAEQLPISENYHIFWSGLPDRRTLSEDGLPNFLARAIPIDKEEYDRLCAIKQQIQQADDDAEYRWYGPDYDRD